MMLYFDSLSVVDELNDEQAGQLLKAMIEYNDTGKVNLSWELKLAFNQFKTQFDRDVEKYENKCKSNRINGSLGGRPKNPNNPDGSKITQPNPNNPNTKTKTKTNKKTNTNTSTTKPTVQEVADYCKERKNNIDAETFVDYFESSGWVKANGQKVKDWKATVRTWEKHKNNNQKDNGTPYWGNNAI